MRLAFSAATLLILGLFGLCCWGAVSTFVDGRRADASPTWPTTNGVVVSAHYRPTEHRGRNTTTCRPEVSYRYSAAGREFSSSRVAFTSDHDCHDAEWFVLRHPVGSEVTVYYEPSDPGISVLTPGGNNDGLVIFLTCICLLIGLPTLVLVLCTILLLLPDSLVMWLTKPLREWNIQRRKRREELQRAAPTKNKRR